MIWFVLNNLLPTPSNLRTELVSLLGCRFFQELAKTPLHNSCLWINVHTHFMC